MIKGLEVGRSSMFCPLYVDYVRTCKKELASPPGYTVPYCVSDKHETCPFYRVIRKIGYRCKNLDTCPAFEHFSIHDFDAFEKITHEYCLSEKDSLLCKRYQIKESGQTPPKELLPDGSMIKGQ